MMDDYDDFKTYLDVYLQRVKVHSPYLDPMIFGPLRIDPMNEICSPPVHTPPV
jgi:hypothetical protein